MTAPAPRVVFFDCECVHSPEADGYSWDRPWELGLAVCCTTERVEGGRQWIEGDAMSLVRYFQEADAVIGFNSHRFDFRLVDGECRTPDDKHNRPPPDPPLVESLIQSGIVLVDMFLDVQEVVGFKKGTGLKPLALHTLGESSPMEGAIAPDEWAEHRKLDVIQYCADDVEKSRKLFNHGLKTGHLKRTSDRGEGPPPVEFPITWHIRDADSEIVEPFLDWYKRRMAEMTEEHNA